MGWFGSPGWMMYDLEDDVPVAPAPGSEAAVCDRLTDLFTVSVAQRPWATLTAKALIYKGGVALHLADGTTIDAPIDAGELFGNMFEVPIDVPVEWGSLTISTGWSGGSFATTGHYAGAFDHLAARAIYGPGRSFRPSLAATVVSDARIHRPTRPIRCPQALPALAERISRVADAWPLWSVD
jgi:hypothetical protein